MEPGKAIRTGIAASVIAHLSVLMLMLLFGEVHLFGSEAGDPVAVDIVTSEEFAKKRPELLAGPEVKPSDAVEPGAKPVAPDLPAPASASVAPEPVTPPQEQAPPSPPPGEKVAAAPPP